jgi:pimeloyl-ACP methyl ester carboxylesterase
MNARGHMLKCSHFMPAEEDEEAAGVDAEFFDATGPSGTRFRPRSRPFPCVVFCHGNAGSRVDALPLLPVLLPAGMSLFAFDFAGAGQSEGEILSLGHYEKDDLTTVVDYLNEKCDRVTRIGIWGHSMGACSCLLYASNGGDKIVSGSGGWCAWCVWCVVCVVCVVFVVYAVGTVCRGRGAGSVCVGRRHARAHRCGHKVTHKYTLTYTYAHILTYAIHEMYAQACNTLF